MDREKFMDMVAVLLRHSYARFGNILVAQEAGITLMAIHHHQPWARSGLGLQPTT